MYCTHAENSKITYFAPGIHLHPFYIRHTSYINDRICCICISFTREIINVLIYLQSKRFLPFACAPNYLRNPVTTALFFVFRIHIRLFNFNCTNYIRSLVIYLIGNFNSGKIMVHVFNLV